MEKQQLKRGDCVVVYDSEKTLVGFVNEIYMCDGAEYLEFYGASKDDDRIITVKIDQWDYKIIDIQL